MKYALSLLTVALILLLLPFSTFATEDLAEKTGKDCGYCHLDPSGGGELAPAGEGYLLSLTDAPTTPGAAKTDTVQLVTRLFKLVIGYIHFLTGVFWFGTILYVHLILKPAYASKGLPRGEVKLGLVSILVMGVTGLILTSFRVPNLEFFFTTRFGILLFTKICIFTLMAGSALIAVFIIGPRLKQKKQLSGPAGAGEMSEEELSSYDGQEGRPAYFAYQGRIYDASDSKLWKNGSHMVRHAAGTDLTSALPQAPHGENKVFDMPEVGILVPGKGPQVKGLEPKKVFFVMAYMNLINVFLIVLLLALWRWW